MNLAECEAAFAARFLTLHILAISKSIVRSKKNSHFIVKAAGLFLC